MKWKIAMKKSFLKNRANGVVAIAAICLMFGCESTYYKTMETMGYHKRDIMVDRVQDARDAQEEAKAQFESALEKFSSVLGFQGGNLEEKYDQLKNEYEESANKASAVRSRIAAVEDVAEDLFAEWQEELNQYTSSNLRRSSARKLRETKNKYTQLIGAMKRAEKKIDPVLSAFKDQVLYLKHNLNAQAIASLQSELASIETDVARLIKEMEASIKEADSFISTMEKG
jgi:archaellum component FlaC